MSVIYRRLISTLINAFFAGTIMIFLCWFIATLLWFVPSYSYVDMSWFFIIFAVAYSTLGNLGLGIIPTFGGRISGTQLRSLVSPKATVLQILFRNTLFFLAPALILASSRLMPNLINIRNSGIFFIIITAGLLLMFTSTLLIPASIIIGRGHRGLHDVLTGLIVCRSNSNTPHAPSAKPMFTRSFLWTLLVSFVLTTGYFGFMFGFGFANILFPGQQRDSLLAETTKIENKLDSIFDITPIKHRKSALSNGFKWWVDLSSDTSERVKVSRTIGLKALDQLDLLGYGVSISKVSDPIELISIDRETIKTVPVGTNIISLFVFLDAGPFGATELQNLICKYFIDRFDERLIDGGGVVMVKAIRLVKVGPIKLGSFNETYITHDNEFWRNHDTVDLPVILTYVEQSSVFSGAFITSSELQ